MVNPIWSRRLSDTYLLECLDNSLKYKTTQLITKQAILYHLYLKTDDPAVNIAIGNYGEEIRCLRDDIEFLNKQIDLIRGRLKDEKT